MCADRGLHASRPSVSCTVYTTERRTSPSAEGERGVVRVERRRRGGHISDVGVEVRTVAPGCRIERLTVLCCQAVLSTSVLVALLTMVAPFISCSRRFMVAPAVAPRTHSPAVYVPADVLPTWFGESSRMHVRVVVLVLLMRPDQLPECPPETRVSEHPVEAAHPPVLLSNPGLPIRFCFDTTCFVVDPVTPAVSRAVTVTVNVPVFV
jgi:hypothetical protein